MTGCQCQVAAAQQSARLLQTCNVISPSARSGPHPIPARESRAVIASHHLLADNRNAAPASALFHNPPELLSWAAGPGTGTGSLRRLSRNNGFFGASLHSLAQGRESPRILQEIPNPTLKEQKELKERSLLRPCANCCFRSESRAGDAYLAGHGECHPSKPSAAELTSPSARSAFPVCLPVWSSQALRRYGEAEKEQNLSRVWGATGRTRRALNPDGGSRGAEGDAALRHGAALPARTPSSAWRCGESPLRAPHAHRDTPLLIWPLQSIFVRVPGIPASCLIAIKGLAGPMLLPERCGAFCSNLSGAPELKVSADGCEIRRGSAAVPAVADGGSAVPPRLLGVLLPGGARRGGGGQTELSRGCAASPTIMAFSEP